MREPVSEDQPTISFEKAVLLLRKRPDMQSLLFDSFLDGDIEGGARRFRASEEFSETLKLLGSRMPGGVIVDVGAGTGIASIAFEASGAAKVYAVEPDQSNVVGTGAFCNLIGTTRIKILNENGHNISLADMTADVVYARQVLHHVGDLPPFLAECNRILKPGGIFVAAREHVINDERQLQAFLDNHPVHQLTHHEGAYTLRKYLSAMGSAGLKVINVFGPLDSVINSFPAFSQHDLDEIARRRYQRVLGPLGAAISRLTFARRWMLRLTMPEITRAPGRLFTFFAEKRKIVPWLTTNP